MEKTDQKNRELKKRESPSKDKNLPSEKKIEKSSIEKKSLKNSWNLNLELIKQMFRQGEDIDRQRPQPNEIEKVNQEAEETSKIEDPVKKVLKTQNSKNIEVENFQGKKIIFNFLRRK